MGYTVNARIEGYKATLAALQEAHLSGTTPRATVGWSRARMLDNVMNERQSFQCIYPFMLHLRSNV